MLLRGRVVVGDGRAAGFTELDWVREQVEQGLGFTLYPGTLNLALEGEARDQVRELDGQPGITLGPADRACCTARCYPILLPTGLPAAIIRPEVPDYPDDKLEIIAACHLRQRLGLLEGAWLEVALPEAARRA